MKTLFPHSHATGELRKSSYLTARAPHAKIAAFAFLVLCMSLVVVGTAVAQYGHYQTPREAQEAEARRHREIQNCIRPWDAAYKQALKDAKRAQSRAEQEAQSDYTAAMRNAKSDAARQAAKAAKQEALRKAQQALRVATRDAQQIMQQAAQSCREPKQPEQTNNNSNNNNSKKPTNSTERSCGPNNSAGGTLGHGPRPRNPTVRMDLRVVDETGRPVRGVKTKLWSERRSNGLMCETVHVTDPCGGVLMDPIHITKTLQLKLEAKGFEPQMIQVDPAQLDRPFRAVMQAKKTALRAANSAK